MHKPVAVCVPCQREFRCEKNGVTLQVNIRGSEEPYYRIASDKYQCPGCGTSILIRFAQEGHPHYAASYDSVTPEVTVSV